MNEEPLRILTWHVHGSYLYYLAQGPYDLLLPVDAVRSPGYCGRTPSYDWPDNVHEVPVDSLWRTHYDAVLYQHPDQWLHDGPALLGDTISRPKIYLEHNAPQGHPTNTHHIVRDPSATLVHCTHFNRLMWDCGDVPTRVVEHGVHVPEQPTYTGTLERALVIVNDLGRRGRRLGNDFVQYARAQGVPIDVIGMHSDEVEGGIGEVPHHALQEFAGHYRVVLAPIRYGSLALSVLEAMAAGCPVVGFNTAEMAELITNGVNGYVSTDPDKVVAALKRLLVDESEAWRLGANARQHVIARHSLERFTTDWNTLFSEVTERAALTA